eukprot:scaffold312698_cov43-Prasinocladus_malaysianus.AAC.1
MGRSLGAAGFERLRPTRLTGEEHPIMYPQPLLYKASLSMAVDTAFQDINSNISLRCTPATNMATIEVPAGLT